MPDRRTKCTTACANRRTTKERSTRTACSHTDRGTATHIDGGRRNPFRCTMVIFTNDHTGKNTVDNQVDKNDAEEKTEWILSHHSVSTKEEKIPVKNAETNSPVPAVSGGYLARPSNIYAEEPWIRTKESIPEHSPVKDQILNTGATVNPAKEDETSPDMQIVFKDDIPAADVPRAHQTQHFVMANQHC